MRNIYFKEIPREHTEEAIKALTSYLTHYEKPQTWEKKKVQYRNIEIHETAKRNVVVRMKK